MGVGLRAAPNLARASHEAPRGARARHDALTSTLTRHGVLAVVVGWNLWRWRAELTGVPYLDDSSVHDQMVRFATARLQAGHLPLTSWFPYLGLGSPQFLHYQSLGAMLTGALGLLTGADTAFRLTLYLLLALWPLSVYASARLLGLERVPSVAAAAVSPLLMSAVGVGYEPKAYIWIGYGVWAQLWASWTLPLAWGFTWRAMADRRAVLWAVVFVALTVCFHFETGYLALIPVALFPFIAPGAGRIKAARAVSVGAGALLATAWVTVPLITQGRFAAIDEALSGTGLVNGYGARQVLRWIVNGQFLDASRLPVVSFLAACGLAWALWRVRSDATARAVLVVLVMSLVLSFGRTTFGSLTSILPGSTDIFMRRFMMGAQLAGVYLAGMGVAGIGRAALSAARKWVPDALGRARRGGGPAVFGLVGAAGVFGLLAPAWTQIDTFATSNAGAVAFQRAADTDQGRQLDRLIAYVRANGGGRVYAGMPSNWGSSFRVGDVPVFKYLESKDVDEVGYTLRTASLMTQPEYYFDETVAGDYPLFGIRYLILPVVRQPAVPASSALVAGPYRLWVLPHEGYLRVVETVGTLRADRRDVGPASYDYLGSPLPGAGRYLTVAFGAAPAAAPTDPAPRTTKGRGSAATTAVSAGRVTSERDDLAAGRVTATVHATRRAVVALSASYDPGWTAVVDGRVTPTEMLAPAIVGVTLDAGVHHVVWQYQGYGSYDALLAVLVLTMGALVAWHVRARRLTP